MIADLQSRIKALEAKVAKLGNVTVAGRSRHEAKGGIAFGAELGERPSVYIPPKTVVVIAKPLAGHESVMVREAKYTGILPKPCVTGGEPPKTICNYVWHGDPFAAYPAMGKKPEDYADDAFGDANLPAFDTVFHTVRRVYGYWQFETSASGGGSKIAQFKIVTADGNGDYVWCNAWDGTTAGTEIVSIARPFTLRRTPFHQRYWESITYEYQNNTQRVAIKTIQAGTPPITRTETQVIVPAYLPDQIIYAAQGIEGGAGIPSPPVGEWLDLNVDGRAWARKGA